MQTGLQVANVDMVNSCYKKMGNQTANAVQWALIWSYSARKIRKVLLQISGNVNFEPPSGYFISSRISRYCSAINAKISDLRSVVHLFFFQNTINGTRPNYRATICRKIVPIGHMVHLEYCISNFKFRECFLGQLLYASILVRSFVSVLFIRPNVTTIHISQNSRSNVSWLTSLVLNSPSSVTDSSTTLCGISSRTTEPSSSSLASHRLQGNV